MQSPLNQMKEVTFWNFLTVKIPERWKCVRQTDGPWGGFEEEADTGTLWVDYDIFTQENPGEDDFRAAAREVVQGLANSLIANGEERVRRHELTEKGPDHFLLHLVEEAADQDDGTELLFLRWHHFGTFPSQTVLVHLTFVLSKLALMDDEIRTLLETMDEELANARIGWRAVLSNSQ